VRPCSIYHHVKVLHFYLTKEESFENVARNNFENVRKNFFSCLLSFFHQNWRGPRDQFVTMSFKISINKKVKSQCSIAQLVEWSKESSSQAAVVDLNPTFSSTAS
jgi:hypothetical protein